MRQKLKKRIILSIVLVVIGIGYYLFFVSPVRGVWIGKIPKEPRRIAKQFLKTVADIPYWGYNLQSLKLPTYILEVKEENLDKLARQLPSDDSVIFDSGEMVPVKAKFKADGKTYDVKIKYRGTTSRHWSYPKKSIRIKFEDKQTFRGFSEINLVVPDSRGYIIEAFNNYRAKKMGLIVPEDDFVNLTINNKQFGVYYLLEGWDENFLTKNKITKTNLYGEETFNDDLYKNPLAWSKYVAANDQEVGNVDDLKKFLKILNDPSDASFNWQITQIVDLSNFYVWNAQAILSGSFHQDYRHNARIYFDQKIKKFKFIPWQVLAWPLADRGNTTYHPLVARLLFNQQFLDAQNKVLSDYVTNEENLGDDFRFYDDLWNKVKGDLFRDQTLVDQNREVEQMVANYRKIIEDNFKIVRENVKQSPSVKYQYLRQEEK